MTKQIKPQEKGVSPPDDVRPLGTWLVAGFLLVVALSIWSLVAFLFTLRT